MSAYYVVFIQQKVLLKLCVTVTVHFFTINSRSKPSKKCVRIIFSVNWSIKTRTGLQTHIHDYTRRTDI